MSSELLAKPQVKLASLEDVLAYENPHLVPKFQESWNLSDEEANELFLEMKKWLWVSGKAIIERSEGADAPVLAVTFPMILLDEMWHTFVLFTLEYREFCRKYFGFYLNHAPTTREEKETTLKEFQEDPEAFQKKQEEQHAAQFSYIYDHLGEETLVKWYSDWTDRFTPEYLDSIHKNYWSN